MIFEASFMEVWQQVVFAEPTALKGVQFREKIGCALWRMYFFNINHKFYFLLWKFIPYMKRSSVVCWDYINICFSEPEKTMLWKTRPLPYFRNFNFKKGWRTKPKNIMEERRTCLVSETKNDSTNSEVVCLRRWLCIVILKICTVQLLHPDELPPITTHIN